MDELTRVIAHLRGWGLGQITPSVDYGVCGNLACLGTLSHATIDNVLKEAFESWPHYSGNREYPVPDPKAPSSKTAAFKIYYSLEDLWEDSPYGNLRRDLCVYAADWLEANKSKVLPLFEEKFHD